MFLLEIFDLMNGVIKLFQIFAFFSNCFYNHYMVICSHIMHRVLKQLNYSLFIINFLDETFSRLFSISIVHLKFISKITENSHINSDSFRNYDFLLQFLCQMNDSLSFRKIIISYDHYIEFIHELLTDKLDFVHITCFHVNVTIQLM